MKVDYVHKDTLTATDYVELNKNNELLMSYNQALLKENKELKKQLEVGEEQYNDLVEEKEKLEEQLSSIALELEQYKNQVNKGLYSACLPYRTGYNKAVEEKENQQKEFIEYLEDEIKRLEENNIYEPLQKMALATHQHNLSKYKEIIGVSNENNMGNTK